MLLLNPEELREAAKKVDGLEEAVHKDSQLDVSQELDQITELLGIGTESDPVTGPLAALIGKFSCTSPVPTSVIRLVSDVLWDFACTAERMQLDITRKCRRASQGLPYTP
ncbi:Uncharacterised protein [Mycobacteroides abscessus subsp. bolletii]|uniref:hypothetical protein n=1 Tax=Mycobacteroides abscessus TaxID=36809 RepID=UPI0009A9100F|nr:hypothetical protein [Mycobacteroides abscessus]SKV05955.1 Uncharacterised protein [Mycobacteroides abscessus subsp. bolletii]